MPDDEAEGEKEAEEFKALVSSVERDTAEVSQQQGSQDGTIQTSQYGRVVDTRLQHITQGNYQYELRYQRGQVDNGDFQICVTINNGVNNCNTGIMDQRKNLYTYM